MFFIIFQIVKCSLEEILSVSPLFSLFTLGNFTQDLFSKDPTMGSLLIAWVGEDAQPNLSQLNLSKAFEIGPQCC